MDTLSQIEVIPLEALETYSEEPYKLILWNDDYNTFDHVIGCMMLYLMKSSLDAMHIAMEVHTKGMCIILGASSAEELEPIYQILVKNNLNCSIENSYELNRL